MSTSEVPISEAYMKKREMSEKFERGLETRRAVLGDRYVEKALAAATDYNWPMQVFVTEYCWDEIWNRAGLSRKERSLLNLGMVASQGRPNEMKAHVRGAINNGWTRDELREAFLQIAVYCGVPTAIDSFKTAQEVFAELDGEGAE